MGIGTSFGAYYDDAHHQAAAEWDDKYDENPVTTASFLSDFLQGGSKLTPNQRVEEGFDAFDKHYEPDKPTKDLPPGTLDNQLYAGDKPRWDRYREDEPGPNEWSAREKLKAAKPDSDTLPDPKLMLGIQETNDNNITDPMKMMSDKRMKADPNNIYDDQGNIIDYTDPFDKMSPLPPLTPMPKEKLPPDLKKPMKKSESDLDSMVVPVAEKEVPGEGKIAPKSIGGKMFAPMEGYSQQPKVNPAGMADKGPERIKSAALKINGEIIEGQNHGMAFEKWMDKNPQGKTEGWKDGFTTTHGRFVSREEAMGIAKKQDQLNPQVKNAIAKLNAANDDSTMLLSEDLE